VENKKGRLGHKSAGILGGREERGYRKEKGGETMRMESAAMRGEKTPFVLEKGSSGGRSVAKGKPGGKEP